MYECGVCCVGCWEGWRWLLHQPTLLTHNYPPTFPSSPTQRWRARRWRGAEGSPGPRLLAPQHQPHPAHPPPCIFSEGRLAGVIWAFWLTCFCELWDPSPFSFRPICCSLRDKQLSSFGKLPVSIRWMRIGCEVPSDKFICVTRCLWWTVQRSSPKLLVNCVFHNACLLSPSLIHTKLASTWKLLQIWGTSSHRQLKPNLNLLVIGGERELATFLRYGPTSEHSAIRTVLLLSKNQVLCSTPSQDCMTARHVQRTHGLALADPCGELRSPSPPGLVMQERTTTAVQLFQLHQINYCLACLFCAWHSEICAVAMFPFVRQLSR